MYTLPKLERFKKHVLSKYNIYNSVFITLPFDEIDNTGALLPLFAEVCEEGFEKSLDPKAIFELFCEKYLKEADEAQKINMMFRFIQYIERQIVLFDAIEDAAFPIVHNMEGRGSLRDLKEKTDQKGKHQEIKHFLEQFNVRAVLTAHPTQFYPGAVLGIITDLSEAIKKNDLDGIQSLLAQLGKTPFIKKEKPTPFDEAVSLIWYLENVFYETFGAMVGYINDNIYQGVLKNALFNLGFWPGGDRDGNPFVTHEITLQVGRRLRTSILKCYYTDIRKLKRKLTFKDVDVIVAEIESKLYRSVFYSRGELYISLDELIEKLEQIKRIVIQKHQSLYKKDIEALLVKINLFGFYFATMDIRQNSSIHQKAIADITNNNSHFFPADYEKFTELQKLSWFNKVDFKGTEFSFTNDDAKNTIASIQTMQIIQEENGERGCNRYIISNNESALHVIETYVLFQMAGWHTPSVDIIPLFESVADLSKAASVMEQLYSHELYQKHLLLRNNVQTVMLGFSDGTKDGGYLMANWSIFEAKEAITEVSRKYGIKVLFFDGRGGPPARGGGKTHKFYASMGPTIENHEIQLTVQGQTISSNFGTIDSCRHNLENLLSAGATNQVFEHEKNTLSDTQKKVLKDLAQLSYEKYLAFKGHEMFIPYLEQVSTLQYYAKTNIGSRPSKRNSTEKLNLNDLRAIPFVGSWSQLKQNVPGFFGVGAALAHYEESNNWAVVESLYQESMFFRTLMDNSMMALKKSFFPLTSYLKKDPVFGEFWTIIHNEFLETERLLLKLSNYGELMENYPDGKASIEIRETIILPLLTIQQYALLRLNELRSSKKPNMTLIATYEKIVIRSLFGNINASRNSA